MLIAFITDSHFDHRNRFQECQRVHEWIYRDCCRRGVGLTLLGGDLFDRRSTPEERNAAAEWLQQMATLGPVLGVRGNHDEDLSLFDELQSLHGIQLVDLPGVEYPVDGISVACLPWPNPANILAESTSREAADQTAVGCLRDVLRGLGDSSPTLFLGHVQVRGSRVGTRQPLIGCSLELGLEDLALVDAKAYLLGHIHLAQDWAIDEAPVIYGGSPYHCNYGEPEAKSYTVLEVVDGEVVSWERVPIPAVPMLLLEADWYPEHTALLIRLPQQSVTHSDIRLRYHCEAENQAAARAAAEEWRTHALAEGAVSVHLDPVVEASTRARAPEVAEARGLDAQLRAFWESKGGAPARAEQLIAKLAQLEGQAA